MGKNKYFVKDGLKITEDFTDISLNTLISNGDALTIMSSYGRFNFKYVNSTGGTAIKFLSKDSAVIFNKLFCDISYGNISVELDFTDKDNADEYVNENDITVNSMHSQVGIKINGANNASCNSNIFHRPDFELCTKYGIWITGESIYNIFLNCRNEEVSPQRILMYIDGNISCSTIDCNTPPYFSNFKVGENIKTTLKTTLNTPNRIPSGMFTDENILFCIGDAYFCITPSKNVAVWGDNKPNTTLYMPKNISYDPRVNQNNTRSAYIVIQYADTRMDIGDDYGYARGRLPTFIVQPSCDITIYKNKKKILKLNNTQQNENISYNIAFVDEYTALSIR